MRFRLVRDLAADGFDVAVTCRLLEVSRSGYYAWQHRRPSARAVADADLTRTIAAIHLGSAWDLWGAAGPYRAGPRAGMRCGRKRVARLMLAA